MDPIIYKQLFKWFIPLFLLSALNLSAQQPPITVRADFQPAVVSIGRMTQYVLTVEGSGENVAGKLPTPDGLEISNTPATGRQFSFVNGVQTATFTYSFQVRPQRTGRFQMPSWEVRVGERSFTVPEATLLVEEPGEEERTMLFMRLENVPEQPFVGEIIPADLVLYIREDVYAQTDPRIGKPQSDADAFTIEEPPPDATARRRSRVDGLSYITTIWPVTLTPIKSGSQTLSFSVDLVLQVPRRRSGGLFNDPFFGPSLFREQQQMTAHTGDISLSIRDLPAANRPDSFSGAVGDFRLTNRLDRNQAELGEPLTLTLQLTGSGNFPRIAAPNLDFGSQWRVYPPKINFAPSDARGITGTLTMEYLLLPQDSATEFVPAIKWSFFHPENARYVSLETEALPVRITGELPSAPTPGRPDALSSNTNRPDSATAPNVNTLPLFADPGTWHHDFRPLHQRPLFWLAQLIPASLLLGWVCLQRQRLRRAADPRSTFLRMADKRVRKAASEAREAFRTNNARAALDAFRRALQFSCARHFPALQKPESLTLAEIESLYASKLQHLPETPRQVMREVFETCDLYEFGGHQNLSPDSLEKLARQLDETLRAFNRSFPS